MGQFRFHGRKAIVREALWGFPEFVSWEETFEKPEVKVNSWQKKILNFRGINDSQGFCEECKTFLSLGGELNEIE